MILKFSLSTTLLLAAAPAFAQSPAPAADPQAAITQTAQAFGQCVTAGVNGLDAAVAAEAGATTVLSGCRTEQEALKQAVEAMIATMPADQQAAAREQVRVHMAEAEQEIAEGIRQRRSAAAAATVPAQ